MSAVLIGPAPVAHAGERAAPLQRARVQCGWKSRFETALCARTSPRLEREGRDGARRGARRPGAGAPRRPFLSTPARAPRAVPGGGAASNRTTRRLRSMRGSALGARGPRTRSRCRAPAPRVAAARVVEPSGRWPAAPRRAAPSRTARCRSSRRGAARCARPCPARLNARACARSARCTGAFACAAFMSGVVRRACGCSCARRPRAARASSRACMHAVQRGVAVHRLVERREPHLLDERHARARGVEVVDPAACEAAVLARA